ncbi:MAG: AAA family ATPase [Candidatus Omnitrophica bacterium]|nr:AAA family ATPase [Candidatus Omnitrophota bacterium]
MDKGIIKGISGQRYQIRERLFDDNLGAVYRAVDLKEHGESVLLKIFNESVRRRPLSALLHFREEIKPFLKAEHPNLLKLLSIGEFEKEDFLVFEDTYGRPLLQYIGRPMGVAEAVNIMLQIATGLDYIHKKDLLHGVLNPSGILVQKKDGTYDVKLTNFGTVSLLNLAHIREPEDIINTFGYMSPEATGILRRPADRRSDIYSTGIVFYQILTGRLPYESSDISTLMHQHIAEEPDSPGMLNPSIPDVITRIVLKLISKEPSDRYQSVTALISDLKEYQSKSAGGKVVVDFEIASQDRTKDITYSTPLIAREEEMNKLKSIVARSKAGKGCLCVVHGESGIGKSRLMDELRGYIHRIGGMYIGTKCYRHESGIPYNVFSKTINTYIDKIKYVSAEERDASVRRIKSALGDLTVEIARITPRIKEYIEDIPKTVSFNPEIEKNKFLITATDFMLNLGTPEFPLIILLDDIQWADEGSLELLGKISEKLESYPLVIIISFSSTDIDSNHPLVKSINKLESKKVPMVRIPLRLFSLSDMTTLVSNLLMEKEKDVEAIADELHEKTRGNPFFAFELLHNLIDEKVIYLDSGRWNFDIQKFREVSLPHDIVETVLARMNVISNESSRIISCASVVGMEVRYDLLLQLARTSPQDVLRAIEGGMRYQFLIRNIMNGDSIYFIHDRVREAFYRRLKEEDKTRLHREVADILEYNNRDNIDAVLPELVYHYREGEVNNKAIDYSIKAGQKSKSLYGYADAIHFYKIAKMLLEEQGMAETERYADVLSGLGEVYRLAGRFEESISVLAACEPMIPENKKIEKSEILYSLGSTYAEKGDRAKAFEMLGRSAKILGYRLPESKFGVCVAIVKEILVQIMHICLPAVFVRKTYSSNLMRSKAVFLFKRMAIVYYHDDLLKMFYLALRCVNIGERLGPSKEFAQGYAMIGGAMGTFVIFPLAMHYGYKALSLSRQMGSKLQEGAALSYLSFSYFMANMHRESAEVGEQGINILRKLGEYWDMGAGFCFTVTGYAHSGRLQESRKWGEDFIDTMQKAGALQMLGWAYGWTIRTRYFIGDLDEDSINELKKCNELAWETNDKTNKVWSAAMVSLGYLRLKEYPKAIKYIEEAMKLYPEYNNMAPWNSEIFLIGAQVYIDFLRDNPYVPAKQRNQYIKKIGSYSRRAMFFGWRYRVYRGWAYQVNGVYNWLIGRKKKAITLWQKGYMFLREHTEDAYRLGSLLLEEAQRLLEENPNDETAIGYLVEARSLLASCGSKAELETASKLLEVGYPAGKAASDSNGTLTLKRHMDALLLIAKAIGSIFNLEDLFVKIIEHVIKVTGAERGFLFIYNDGNNTLELKAASGRGLPSSKVPFSYENYGISLNAITQSTDTHNAIIANSEDETSSAGKELKRYGIKEAMCVPLLSKEKILGFLYIDNHLTGGLFGVEELDLMRSFAIQAAVSLENARLYESIEIRVKERTRELEAVNKELKREVTGRKNMEQELRNAYTELQRTKEQLIQAEKLRGVSQLASGIIHEVKNPLGVVMQGVDYLQHNMPAAENNVKLLEILDIMKDSIDKADRVASSMADFLKIKKLQVVPEDINSIIENSLLLVRHKLKTKNISVQKEIDSNLPPVMADKGKIEQAIINILLNSIQAVPNGGNILITTYHDSVCNISDIIKGSGREADFGDGSEKVAVIRVEDNGSGIPEDNMKRIFKPFFTTKTETEGAGLGLSIVKNIVELHRGLIYVESKENAGTKVSLILRIPRS